MQGEFSNEIRKRFLYAVEPKFGRSSEKGKAPGGRAANTSIRHPELFEVFTELAKAKHDYDSERQSRRQSR